MRTSKTTELSWNWSPLYKNPCNNLAMSASASCLYPKKSHSTSLVEWFKQKTASVSHNLNGVHEAREPTLAKQRRLRRQMEIEAKQIGVAPPSPTDSDDEHTTTDAEEPPERTITGRKALQFGLKKAKSVSPGREEKKPSYRQYLREKRSKSKDQPVPDHDVPPRYQSAGDPTDDTDSSKSATQVHWKVHKISPGVQQPLQAETNGKRYAEPPNIRPVIEQQPKKFAAPSDMVDSQQPISDKSAVRKSWLNATENRRRGLTAPLAVHDENEFALPPPSTRHSERRQDFFTPSLHQPSLEPNKNMSLLSQSVHGALVKSTSGNQITPATSLGVVSLVRDAQKPRGPLAKYRYGGQQQRSFTESIEPSAEKTRSTLMQQNSVPAFTSQMAPAGRFTHSGGEGSSPLDTVPVKDMVPVKDQSKSPTLLRISENSAFRPVKTNSPLEFGSSFGETGKVSDQAKIADVQAPTAVKAHPSVGKSLEEEPIYVSMNEVTSHSPYMTQKATTGLAENQKTDRSLTEPATSSKLQDVKVSRQAAQSTPYKSESNMAAPPLIKAFVAKPPIANESNLERWRARKKTLEDAKQQNGETTHAEAGTRMKQPHSRRHHTTSGIGEDFMKVVSATGDPPRSVVRLGRPLSEPEMQPQLLKPVGAPPRFVSATDKAELKKDETSPTEQRSQPVQPHKSKMFAEQWSDGGFNNVAPTLAVSATVAKPKPYADASSRERYDLADLSVATQLSQTRHQGAKPDYLGVSGTQTANVSAETSGFTPPLATLTTKQTAAPVLETDESWTNVKSWPVTPKKLEESATPEGAAAALWKVTERRNLEKAARGDPAQFRSFEYDRLAQPTEGIDQIFQSDRMGALVSTRESFDLSHPEKHKLAAEIAEPEPNSSGARIIDYAKTPSSGPWLLPKGHHSSYDRSEDVWIPDGQSSAKPLRNAILSTAAVSSKAKSFEDAVDKQSYDTKKPRSPRKRPPNRSQTCHVIDHKSLSSLVPSETDINQNFYESTETKKYTVPSRESMEPQHAEYLSLKRVQLPNVPEEEAVLSESSEKDPDQCKMSVSEKKQLFEKKIEEVEKKARRKGQLSRFQTQPITQEEVAAALRQRTGYKEQEFAQRATSKEHEDVVGPESGPAGEPRVRARIKVTLHSEHLAPPRDQSPENSDWEKLQLLADLSTQPANLPPSPDTRLVIHANEERQPALIANRNNSSLISPDDYAVDQTRGSLRKSQTLPVSTEDVDRAKLTMGSVEEDPFRTPTGDGMSIAQRVALLKHSGQQSSADRTRDAEVLWRDTTPPARDGAPSPDVGLSERKSRLLESQRQWHSRVEDKDTRRLTVEGKLEQAGLKLLHTPSPARLPRTTEAKVAMTTRVPVPTSLDEGLGNFWTSRVDREEASASIRIDPKSLDHVAKSADQSTKLVLSKGVRPPRRKSNPSNRNPIKALQERQGELVRDSYETSVVPLRQPATPYQPISTPHRPKTAVLDPLLKPGNRGTQLADEALRALSAKEDWGAVKLKKAEAGVTPGQSPQEQPYLDPMLLQVKGRKHVHLRLVQPNWKHLNSGDCFVLVNKSAIYLYDGRFANVLEKAKAKEVANYVLETHDLGCKEATAVVPMDEQKLVALEDTPDYRLSENEERFWALLGGGACADVAVPTSADEDEVFEERVVSLNMVYKVVEDENAEEGYVLQFCKDVSGKLLHFSLLQDNRDQVLVLDFGSELYAWSGRDAPSELRRAGARLARALWEKPFKCPLAVLNPFDPAADAWPVSLPNSNRPDWCLWGHVKDRMETCLFRGKFVDWPEVVSRSLKVKGTPSSRGGGRAEPPASPSSLSPPSKRQILAFKDPSYMEMPPEELATTLLERTIKEPDLVLEDHSVGRGRLVMHPHDPRLGKFQVVTEEVTMLRVPGTAGEVPLEVGAEAFGQFRTDTCYIIRWAYRLSAADRRTLSGEESKQSSGQTGRSRLAFFYWQGADTSAAEQGACALALRDLDKAHSPRIRVTQGLEPPAFLNLFQGRMVIHRDSTRAKPWRLFALLGGPFPTEACLTEVIADPRVSLRPQGVFLLINADKGLMFGWMGLESMPQTRDILRASVEKLRECPPAEFDFKRFPPSFRECMEGNEPEAWIRSFSAATGKLQYPRPSHDSDPRQGSLRLFRFTSSSGSGGFGAVECLSSWFSPEAAVPFPFEQDDLYGASQPAFFLLDQGGRLWLWEGFVENQEDEGVLQKLRLQRLYAVKAAVAYANGAATKRNNNVQLNVVYAGVEPRDFKALFPTWTDQLDAKEINLTAGRAEGATVEGAGLLRELSVAVYAASRLRQRPPPEGVDGSRLEAYLSPDEFFHLFSMSKHTFDELPDWKQIRLKKESQLF